MTDVAFRTFGCKANQYDTERMRQELEARGARTVAASDQADCLVLNTCTVTSQADAEARRHVRRARRENPALRILVVGCSAALRGEEYEGMSGVAGVVRGHDPVEVAGSVLRSGPPLIQLGSRLPLDRVDGEPIGASILQRRDGASRGWLKIQDGCDRKCSFCATRLARGASRSRRPGDVVEEAAVLARTHPEIVLTGIHIGHYGRDLEPENSLSSLVARLLEEVPEARFRLGSVEATEIDDRLLELLVESNGQLAPHLHMPLQSGADPVLRRMRRWHSREAYRTRALEIAGRMSALGFGADIITGFPGESEADHRETVALVEELPYTYLHVFPFSPRAGTPASELNREAPVPQRVAGERSRELREIVRQKAERYKASRDGARAEIVTEQEGRVGLTGDYLRVTVSRTGSRGSGGGGGPESPHGAVMPRLAGGRLAWRQGELTIDLTAPRGFN